MRLKTKSQAAVFDVDGTLLADTSMERLFVRRLLRCGELDGRQALRFLRGALETTLEGGSPLRENKGYLRGKDAAAIRRLARACFEADIAPRLLPAAIERLRRHQAAGHFVVLLSGTLDALLEPLAEHLGVGARIGADLERDGRDALRLTGRIVGLHPRGPAKAECLRVMIDTLGLDPARCFAYADAYADRFLLRMVGHPIAVRPDRRLRRLARARGWRIVDFSTDATRVPCLPRLGNSPGEFA